ncbi:MAG: zf-HC2 domain-containing protein [Bacteroidia bacterium]|nr:zf-HC2 domain-containing protein [Bacteroidia bacterium]
MRCNTAQQLLHLHRNGERTDRQERRLARHLRGCPSCRESATGGMSEYDSLLNTVRQALPNADSEDAIVRSVLARITQQEQRRARERTHYSTAQSMFLPYAAAMLLVLIAGGFLLQFITVHNRVEVLARSLADAAMPPVTVDISYELHPTTAQLASLDSLCLPSGTATMLDQRRQISRVEAESLLRFAAMHPRCRRQIEDVIFDRVSSDVDITPMLTLRIQHQGA